MTAEADRENGYRAGLEDGRIGYDTLPRMYVPGSVWADGYDLGHEMGSADRETMTAGELVEAIEGGAR